ncbi:mitochondrial fission ELM1 family protein [Lysobacter sp. GX 14042]|uniref:mitochondrial fission ELM1 family protein n=1 Tax=Lysobacter sp. GX 14042 TaxID=2907155 RepID=UPI001F241F83|nr:mitochondrial fission ELM1 family protein [Lysobacter sp. GX 14042]MCE7033390.1 mitochondrial fission ELM1 family protein [Lysobacter sp. GX 14042]
MPTSAVWTITDGNAGNVRQAHALAAALSRPIRDWTLKSRAPWRWVAPRRLPGAAGAFGHGFADALSAPPDLAIGCGRQSALATRLLRIRGSRVVQILDPRLDPRHWDLVVAPEHDGLDGPNVVRLLGSLHPVDAAWLMQAREHYTALATLPRPRTTLLLGGNSGHARLDEGFLHATLDVLLRQLKLEGGSLLASTSRRTPAGFANELRKRLAGYESLVWTGPQDGGNPYPGLLAHADRIVCTGDSVNMLSEAAATAVPVHIAGAERVSGRPRRFIDSLLGGGRARLLGERMDGYPVTPLRETARVAAEVEQRLRR